MKKDENAIVRRNVSTILRDILQYKKILKKENKESELGQLYFRGESDDYGYRLPSLYRKENSKLIQNGSEYYYRYLLSELGRDDYIENSSLVSLLSELQHYGACTRMLDVTKSPLIALYFAVENNSNKPGYIYIYSLKEGEEKFDTGHTVAIKSALNLISQEVINKFILACRKSLNIDTDDMIDSVDSKKLLTTLDRFNEEKKLSDSEKLDVIIFMDQLNQRAKVREKLNYPFKIYRDLMQAHLIIPSKKTDRIRQQQGAFIFPKYVCTSDMSVLDIQKKIDESVSKLGKEIITEKYKTGERIAFSVIKINAGDKKNIREELEQLGITEGFIYPDIEHQSKALLNKFK